MDLTEAKKGRVSVWGLIVLLVFLYAVDLFDKAGIIISVACLLCILFSGTKRVPKAMVVLMAFGVSYTVSLIIFESVSFDSILKYMFLPSLTYYLGFSYGKKKGDVDSVYKFMVIILCGFFAHSLLNLGSYLKAGGLDFNVNYRWASEFWRGGAEISVILNSLYSAPMAYFCTGILITQNSKWKKVLAALCLGIIVFAMMLYQNRTTILVIAILVIIAIIRSWKNGLRISTLLICIGAVVALIATWSFNLFGVRSFVEGTTLYYRLSSTSDADRFQIWWSFIKGNPILSPFGGRKIALYLDKPYVHNMWLDTWWRVGIVPFICLVYITWDSFKVMHDYAIVEQKKRNKVIVINWMLLGLMINFLVEPVLEANPFIFYIPLLIVGAARGGMQYIQDKTDSVSPESIEKE